MKDAADAILRPEQARYLASLERPRDELLARMEAYAAEHRQPISDPEVANFLSLVARLRKPALVVELGTNIGYGAIVLARAAPAARVVTVEHSPSLCALARSNVREAGLESRVTVVEGFALAELERFAPESIDFAYVDCVKEEYVDYLAALAPRLSLGGVLVADNVLWKGHVAAAEVPEGERKRTAALRSFNAALVAHARLSAAILPFGDGVAFAVKTAS